MVRLMVVLVVDVLFLFPFFHLNFQIIRNHKFRDGSELKQFLLANWKKGNEKKKFNFVSKMFDHDDDGAGAAATAAAHDDDGVVVVAVVDGNN